MNKRIFYWLIVSLWLLTIRADTLSQSVKYLSRAEVIEKRCKIPDFYYKSGRENIPALNSQPISLEKISDIGGSSTSIHVLNKCAYVVEGVNLVILDVSTPSNPRFISRYRLNDIISNLFVSGTTAYVGTYKSGLHLVDVSNPDNLKTLSKMSDLSFILDLQVANNYAYIADTTGFRILDVHDPFQPKEIYRSNIIKQAVSVHVVGAYAYICDVYKLHIVDISNPAAPQELISHTITDCYPYDVYVTGGRAYIRDYSDILHILDISNPNNITKLGSLSLSYDRIQDIKVKGNFAYIISTHGLQIVDIHNPQNIVERGFIKTDGNGLDIEIVDNYVYAATYSENLLVIDVRNPWQPKEAGKWLGTIPRAFNVQVKNKIAYIAAGAGGLRIIDLNNPLQPKNIGNFDPPGFYARQDLDVFADKVHILDMNNRSMRIIDISNQSSPQEFGSISIDPIQYPCAVTVDKNYAYVAWGLRGLKVINVSNPQHPFVSGTYETPDYAWNLDLSGNHVLIADQQGGLRIADVSNPTNPREIGANTNLKSARDVKVAGNFAYVLDDNHGLVILDISDIQNPIIISNTAIAIRNPQICLAGKYAFIAGYLALQIFDIRNPSNPVLVVDNYPISANTWVDVEGDLVCVANDIEGLLVLRMRKPAEEMLTNGDFSNGDTGWQMYVFEAASASGSVQNGEYVVSIPNGGDQSWQVQLMQTGLLIENGKKYDLTFEAYALSPRKIGAAVTRNSDPWTWYDGSSDFQLTTSKQTFRYSFIMNMPTDPAARVLFELGGTSVDVYFDNVSLKEGVMDYTKKRYVAAQIPAGTPVPTIDGVLNDAAWNSANPSEWLRAGGTPNNWAGEWISFSDNQVTWKAVWSDLTNMLYVAVEVQDDIAGLSDHDYDWLWQDDCVEFFTDGDRSGGPFEGNVVNAQGWMIRRDNAKHLNWTSGALTGSVITSAVQLGNAGNWVLEVGMKIYNQYDAERKQLKKDDVIGWDVWYNDSDNKYQDNGLYIRDHQVGWGYTGPAWNNADYMHELELGVAPVLTALVVTNTNDSGAGSLREAITKANNNSGPDTILFQTSKSDENFDANLGVWTIQPESPLPAITDDELFIDGASQVDFIGEDTNLNGPEIVINGSKSGMNSFGFHLASAGNQINQLVINGFFIGIRIIRNSNRITGNYIGTDPAGKEAVPNDYGILIIEKAKSNIIGGDNPDLRNLVSGNHCDGIQIGGVGTDHNLISGNSIGTDITGEIALGNGWSGISISLGAMYTTIGGASENERNIISGNNRDGIRSQGSHTNVFGNYIGANAAGTKTIGNQGDGVSLMWGSDSSIVGGTEPGEGNLIIGNQLRGISVSAVVNTKISGNFIGTNSKATENLGNKRHGISISYGAQNSTIGPANVIAFNTTGIFVVSDSSTQNTITQNSITKNGGMGIDNYLGGNTELNPPQITLITSSSISGTAPANSTVEIFSDPEDEGKIYEGTVIADGAGNFQWIGTVSEPNVTATATDAAGNTSEFSSPYIIAAIDMIQTAQVPTEFSVSQNYPNPFNPATTIYYSLPSRDFVTLEVYNCVGRKIRTLVNQNQVAGYHSVVWDGQADNGLSLASGIYLYHFKAGTFTAIKKMILIK